MTVDILKCPTYEYTALKPALYRLLSRFDSGMINPGMRVLIKPNLLAPAPPEKAIITHPLVIRAVAEYVLEKGAKVRISDSPAMGSFEKVLKTGGIQEALNGLDLECVPFVHSLQVDIGHPFNTIEIARDVLEADVVINLPKLKTHTQMLLTLGVKNLFGCIVGMKKPEWHFRAGVDREIFARLLFQIYMAIKPQITIIDGILAMEGEGPGRSGTPRQLGLLVGSSSAAAADLSVCRMLSIAPEQLLTTKIALEAGHLSPEPVTVGEIPQIRNFLLPRITPLVFGPRHFHGFFRRHLVQRPAPDHSLCKLCGECWRYCPAKAITSQDRKVHFDYDACIRCYCCIEVCPHGALHTHETLLGRLVRKVLR